MKPLISVIIPCFNQSHLIARALKSIEQNKCAEFEIESIVIDDGSTDIYTKSRLKKLQRKYPFKLIQTSNQGLSAARNVGLSSANGDYIQFLDADDWLSNKKLLFQFQKLNLYDLDIHIVGFKICYNWPWNKAYPTGIRLCPDKDFLLEDFVNNWETKLSIPIHCALFKKKCIDQIRFHEKMKAKEDWYFWISLALKGVKISCSEKVGAFYFKHTANMTNDEEKMKLLFLDAIPKLKNLLSHKPDLVHQLLARADESRFKEVAPINHRSAIQEFRDMLNPVIKRAVNFTLVGYVYLFFWYCLKFFSSAFEYQNLILLFVLLAYCRFIYRLEKKHPLFPRSISLFFCLFPVALCLVFLFFNLRLEYEVIFSILIHLISSISFTIIFFRFWTEDEIN